MHTFEICRITKDLLLLNQNQYYKSNHKNCKQYLPINCFVCFTAVADLSFDVVLYLTYVVVTQNGPSTWLDLYLVKVSNMSPPKLCLACVEWAYRQLHIIFSSTRITFTCQ